MKRLLAVGLLILGLCGCGSNAKTVVAPPVKAMNFAWGEYGQCCDGCFATVSQYGDADVCWGGTLPCPEGCPGGCAN